MRRRMAARGFASAAAQAGCTRASAPQRHSDMERPVVTQMRLVAGSVARCHGAAGAGYVASPSPLRSGAQFTRVREDVQAAKRTG